MAAVLHGLVERALLVRDDDTVLGLSWDYLVLAWVRRNRLVLADHVAAALLVPFRTLAAKVRAGGVPTVTALQTLVEQVLAVNGRKYGARAFRRWNPRLGHGRRKAAGDASTSAPPLIVFGWDLLPETVDRGGRPEDRLRGAELALVVDRVRASVDPNSLAVFDAVQAYRTDTGVAGAFPFVASLPVADHLRTQAPAGGEDEVARETRERRLRSKVRRTWLRVRRTFADRLAAAGYPVPADEPRKRRWETTRRDASENRD